jgi:mono/diheme cytochrome c family protein
MVTRTRDNVLMLCGLVGLMIGLSSAAQDKQVPKEPESTASTVSAGAELYTKHCAVCHGADLKGNGPFPAPYRTPPDLSTLARRHAGKFPEAYVSNVLHNGVKLPAHKPAEMPVWAATTRLDKDHTDSWVRNLIDFIKSRQEK